MNEPYTILLVSGEEADLVVIDYMLQGCLAPGCTVKRAATQGEAELLLGAGKFDACLVDAGPGNQAGLAFASEQRRRDANLPVILLTDGEDQDLDQQVEASGAVDFLPKGRFHAYRLVRTVRAAIERQALIARIERLEQYDELTGLAKQDVLACRLGQMVALGKRSKFEGAFALFRVWELDQIALTFGPSWVDYALVRLAGRLGENVREADMVGRWDQACFAVVAGNIGDRTAAATMTQKVIDALEQPIRLDMSDVCVPVTASFVLWPSEGDEVDLLIEQAQENVNRPPAGLAQTA